MLSWCNVEDVLYLLRCLLKLICEAVFSYNNSELLVQTAYFTASWANLLTVAAISRYSGWWAAPYSFYSWIQQMANSYILYLYCLSTGSGYPGWTSHKNVNYFYGKVLRLSRMSQPEERSFSVVLWYSTAQKTLFQPHRQNQQKNNVRCNSLNWTNFIESANECVMSASATQMTDISLFYNIL